MPTINKKVKKYFFLYFLIVLSVGYIQLNEVTFWCKSCVELSKYNPFVSVWKPNSFQWETTFHKFQPNSFRIFSIFY